MDFMEEMGSQRYGSDDDDKGDFDIAFDLGDDQQQAADSAGAPPASSSSAAAAAMAAAGGGKDGGYNRHKQLDWMSEMGSGRYRPAPSRSSSKLNSSAQGSSSGGGGGSDSSGKRGLMSDVAAAFGDMFTVDVGRQQHQSPGKAAGDVDFPSNGDDDGAAAVRQMHDEWQREGEEDAVWAGYGPPGNRSVENMGASFEFDFEMGGLTSMSTDGSLPDITQLEHDLSMQQQQQQQQQQSTPAAGAMDDSNAQVIKSRRSAAGRTRGGGVEQQQKSRTRAASAAVDGRTARSSQGGTGGAGDGEDAPSGFVGSSSGDLDAADGFETGWADRLMADVGPDHPVLDDVMADFGDDGDVTSSRRSRSR
jgi:hypothetical protein